MILAEKALPGGERLAWGTAVALVALVVRVGAAAASVPGLAEPQPMRMMGG